jgi:hypothetical protein
LLLLFGLVGCNQQRQTSSPIEVSAVQLETDYEVNASTAEEKYQKQTLIVNGKISHYAVLRDTIGVYLERSNRNSNWRIICFIDYSPDVYSRLKRGENTTFIGTLRSDKDNFFIKLTDCKIK